MLIRLDKVENREHLQFIASDIHQSFEYFVRHLCLTVILHLSNTVVLNHVSAYDKG